MYICKKSTKSSLRHKRFVDHAMKARDLNDKKKLLHQAKRVKRLTKAHIKERDQLRKVA